MRALGLALLLGALLALAACAPMATDTSGQSVAQAAQPADALRRADVRLQLAQAYFAEGQYATALNELDLAYQTGQRRAEVLGLRALVLKQQGDNAGAGRSLRQALQIEPDNPGLLNNMGWLLCDTGDAAEGLAYVRRALAQRQYASRAKALVNAGRCSVRIGRADDATSYFRQAVALEPDQPIAHAGLARLAYASGDYSRARAHLLKVLATDEAAKDDYLMALSVERKLGDAAAEQSLARQWQKRFPGDALGGSSNEQANDR